MQDRFRFYPLVLFVNIAVTWLISFAGSDALSLGSTFDTADLLKDGGYDFGLEPQYVFNTFPGANLIGHYDLGVSETGNVKFVLGSGSTNFQAGAYYKVVPFPDYNDQPGIGIFGGVLYAAEDGTSFLYLRANPMISKRFKTFNSGEFTPYLALPFGVAFYSNTTTVPVQLEVGTKWLPPNAKHLNIFAELGLDVSNAWSYISAGITVPFDSFDTIKVD